jgi:hypothetical protein
MEYLFSKCDTSENDVVTIPKWAVDRWRRQIATPYADLSSKEQESDRVEARKFLEKFEEYDFSEETYGRYENHIGKRSAAGPYCWDCSQTLCVQGEDQVHLGVSEWHISCPKCKSSPDTTGHNAAKVELGFQPPASSTPSGVSSCSSFSWGIAPEKVFAICESKMDEPIIVNEYGEKLTGEEFLNMLSSNCPIWNVNMIGEEFC